MKKYSLTIVIILVCGVVRAQQDIDWQTLADIKWIPTYMAEYDDYYNMPKFSKKVKALDGKEIIVKGFYVPVDATGTMFALSAYPSSMCFFCNGAGLESVIEVVPKKGESSLKHIATDKYIQVKGKLKLNQKEADHLMYVLLETELVKIIK
ncbi:MAG: hypothetical protein LBL04_17185 [Bacteroidales bacterium]|jgi:hypothetical protein|nr:hypothetical protein [Bacteroidales bacterium]